MRLKRVFRLIWRFLKKIFPILLLFLALSAIYFSISHRETILTFLGLTATLETIELRIYYQWIGGIIVGAALVWNAISLGRRVKAQTKQLEIEGQRAENEAYSNKNQQFLDAIRLFEKAKTLETKKGALFHLENLAISSPAHRQRVMDFLNSLNSWMRDEIETLKDLKIEKWDKWKNEKRLLFEECTPELKDKQLLSAEIPKIFENIIKKHSKDWDSHKIDINFSSFVLPQIDLNRTDTIQDTYFGIYTFPQEVTDFYNSVFLGYTNFEMSIFKSCLRFINTNFYGHTTFRWSKFHHEIYFFKSLSQASICFDDTKILNGIRAFSSTITPNSQFSFVNAEFGKHAYFDICELDFYMANFKNLTIDIPEKVVFFSSKNSRFKDTWQTVQLTKRQKAFYFNLTKEGKPKPDWTEEEKTRWKTYKEQRIMEEERKNSKSFIRAEKLSEKSKWRSIV